MSSPDNSSESELSLTSSELSESSLVSSSGDDIDDKRVVDKKNKKKKTRSGKKTGEEKDKIKRTKGKKARNIPLQDMSGDKKTKRRKKMKTASNDTHKQADLPTQKEVSQKDKKGKVQARDHSSDDTLTKSASASSETDSDDKDGVMRAARKYVYAGRDAYEHAENGPSPSRTDGHGKHLDKFERSELQREKQRLAHRAAMEQERDKQLIEKIRRMRDQAEKDIENEAQVNFAERDYQNFALDEQRPVALDEAVEIDNPVFGFALTGRFGKIYRSMVIYSFLITLGGVTACLGLTVDIMIVWIRKFHFLFVDLTDADQFSWFGWGVYIVIGTVLGLAAAIVTDKISPTAVGSGIPEVKCILNGVGTMLNFLSFRTLVSKTLGLTLAIGSGMWVGKEGPFIHFSAVVCNQMFRFYRTVQNNDPLKLQLIGAAVGVGVASNFGAVLGGVLFSIEATSTYYPVRNYWYSAVGCGAGGLVFRVLHNMYNEHPDVLNSLIHADYALISLFDWHDLGMFLFIGITTGLMSVVFVKMVVRIILFRKKNMAEYSRFLGPIPYTVFVAFVISIFGYPNLFGDYMSSSGYPTLEDLVNARDLDAVNATIPIKAKEWTDGHGKNFVGVWKNLLIFFCLKFAMIPFAITAGVPAGLFVPTLYLGAAWGRLCGGVVAAWGAAVVPGGYGVVAAAAMTGAITQTYSTSIIVLELTGQLTYSMPILLGTTISIMVARIFCESIFSEIAKAKAMPFLDELRYWQYKIPASEIMQTDFMFLTRRMHLRSILSILKARDNKDFPVLRHTDDPTLIGSVTRDYLSSLVYKPLEKGKTEEFRKYWFLTGAIEREPKSDAELAKTVELDYSEVPFQLLPSTPLSAIHVLFVTLRLKTTFVTERGKLRGIISRVMLRKAIEDFGIKSSTQYKK